MTKSPLGETRVITWASFHCGFELIREDYRWNISRPRSIGDEKVGNLMSLKLTQEPSGDVWESLETS